MFLFADWSDFARTIPSGTSLRSEGDDEIRRFKTKVGQAWEEEHYGDTTNSGNSAGIHAPGSSRLSWVSGSDPSAGEEDDEGRFVYRVDDNSLWLGGPSAVTKIVGSGGGGSGVKAYITSGQLVTTSTSSVSFQAEDYDTDAYFNTADSDTSFVVPADGLYLLQLQLATAVSEGWEIAIRRGDGTLLAKNAIDDDAGFDFHCSTVDQASEGDMYYCEVQKLSGSDRNILAGLGNSFFAITRQ